MALQVSGVIMGGGLSAIAKLDPLIGLGFGMGIGSVNFGVSVTVSSKS
ncbi:hypothetical protein VB715_18870 [Crocosphaera sp. UHCC 0190]|nr:hypothetical protein [Crocosphaera sp. UHCC 0190]MEA5511838.1 hypothetical protein [Crocosphaera sp. UHCC 0190]